MNRFWELVLLPALEALEPRCIVEVGAANGALTTKLLEWGAEHDAVVHSIDPQPDFDLTAWRKRYGKQFVFHKGRSLNVLGRIENVDAALIDGDHNWYTVIGELRILERTALAVGRPPPLVGLHDVDWPYGRRDLYYNPESIPAAHRQPYQIKGILPREAELSHAGLNGHLNNATHENSIHNGVRTAVEDFLSESQLDWKLHSVPGLHGLGILLSGERLTASPRLSSVVNSFGTARFLRRWCGAVELARVHAEIAIATRRESERKLAEQAAKLRGELERLHRQLELAAGTEAELRRELVSTRTQVEEADERRRAAQVIAGVAGNGGEPALSDPGAVWSGLAGALQSFEETVSTTFAERDPMFNGDHDSYLAISRSALGAIVHALAAAGISQPKTILDLPCGYGRVTRALRAAWPAADLVAADQSTVAVAFCVEQFAAAGWVLEDYPALEQGEGQLERFDLIWSGSLLSSIEPGQIDDCLSSLLAMLRPNGILVAAYHGRDSTRRFSEQSDKSLQTLAEAVAATGVGFRAREADGAVGTTAMTSHWLLEHITRHRTATVLSVIERGWADHLDVVAIARRDVHHRQRDIRPA
jgi:SAM-dependent methyltransferase